MRARRWPALDGLRGVAILLVVQAHFGLGVTGGMVGVTLFFVLSGFLITYLLLDERERGGRIDLKAFYARRALRLLPALVFYLVGIVVLAWAMRLDLPIWKMTWPPVLYVANYVQILGVDLFAHRHTWSLAVEEHFYLVWPVLVLLGATKNLKPMVLVLASLVMWRFAVGLSDPVWAYMATDTNAYALGFGCLLGSLRHRGVRLRLPPRSAEIGVGALVLLSVVPHEDLLHLYQIGVWLPIVAATASGLAIWASTEIERGFLCGRFLGWLGGISYALYLWHAPLLQLPITEEPAFRVVAVAASVGIALISWRLIEAPILRSRLRRRFTPRTRILASTDSGPDMNLDMPLRSEGAEMNSKHV